MEKEEIISRISYIRKRAKFTQKALSAKLGMNPSYINRLECQKDFEPSLRVLMQIIDVCNSTPEEFFYNDIKEYERIKKSMEDMEKLRFQLLVDKANGTIAKSLGIQIEIKENK
ncbi:MAG: helix-turn-helix domain-containing protein [Acetobacter sp.]|nr:helix-turn-helix domain-containing protein [Acetobacter sp.]